MNHGKSFSGTGFQPVALHRPEDGATDQEVLPGPPPWGHMALIRRLPFLAWQKLLFCRIVAGNHD